MKQASMRGSRGTSTRSTLRGHGKSHWSRPASCLPHLTGGKGVRAPIAWHFLAACCFRASWTPISVTLRPSTARRKVASVDREWRQLPDVVGDLLARFDAHMADLTAAAKATPVNRLRAEILEHVRGARRRETGSLHADGPDRRRQDARFARLCLGTCKAAQSRSDCLRDPVHLGHRPDGLHFSRRARRRSRSRTPRVHRRSRASRAGRRATNCAWRWRTGRRRSW